MRIKSYYRNLQLSIFSIFITFILIEIFSRLFLFYLATPEEFLLYASYAQLERRYHLARFVSHQYLGYVTTPNYMWGNNRHNALGFRGDEIALPKPTTTYRIVCMGGSTTYSDGVQDYTKSYPVLLEKYLHEQGWTNVEVINAGVPGYTSLESLINLQTRVLDLEPDLIINYDGSNDFHARLVWPPAVYRGDYSGFRSRPPFFANIPFLENSTALRILMVRQGWIEPHSAITRIFLSPATSYTQLFNSQKRNGSYPAGIFQETTAAMMLAQNQPIYLAQNLNSMIAIAQANQIDIILATYAYSPFFPDEITAYAEFQQASAEHHQVMKNLATATGVYFYDFAKQMPVDEMYYTDGIHFTEAGNEVRAKLFGDFIVGNIFIEQDD